MDLLVACFADWRGTHGYDVHGLDRPDDISQFDGGDYGLIIHLAAWADIRESLEKPEEYYNNNVVKAKPIFDWCKDWYTSSLWIFKCC